jgi:hypothetical protein
MRKYGVLDTGSIVFGLQKTEADDESSASCQSVSTVPV